MMEKTDAAERTPPGDAGFAWARAQLRATALTSASKEVAAALGATDRDTTGKSRILVYLDDETLHPHVHPKKDTPLNGEQFRFISKLDEVEGIVRNHLPHHKWPDFLANLVSVGRIGLEHEDLSAATERMAKLRDDVIQCCSDLIQVFRIKNILMPSGIILLALGLLMYWGPDVVLYNSEMIRTWDIELVGLGGLLGCLVSVVLRSGKEIADIRVDRELLRWMTWARPFMAAIITVIAYLYIRTGVFVKISTVDLSDPLIGFLVGFLLGFNERFYSENFLAEAATRLSSFAPK